MGWKQKFKKVGQDGLRGRCLKKGEEGGGCWNLLTNYIHRSKSIIKARNVLLLTVNMNVLVKPQSFS